MWSPCHVFPHMSESIFMKLCMCIMTTEPMSTAYFIDPSQQSVCLHVSPSYCCKAMAQLSVSLHLVLDNGSVTLVYTRMFPQQ
jgi:hypothetical protein